MLAWGLRAPGKGIEWAIAALGQLRGLRPTPRYLIAGRTHPKVLAEQGESYRAYLRRQAERFGVADLVAFDPDFRTTTALTALLHQADTCRFPTTARMDYCCRQPRYPNPLLEYSDAEPHVDPG